MLKRSSLVTLVAVCVAVCGPSAPSSTGTGGSPSANVHATGKLSFPSCSAEGCMYQGTVTNDGPDCASNVRGVTHLFDASGKQLETQPWQILGRVRRGETTYRGCCFTQGSVDSHRGDRTDVSFESLLCI